MTNQYRHTFTLTAEEAEDLFDAINVAGLYYGAKVDEAKRNLGSYDWRVSSADKLTAFEARRDLFTKRWVEFYQRIKVVRADEKALTDGRAWIEEYRAGKEVA